ncbi:hypothetical protein HELRODRAFT_181356 [Helobdella robusta]|uniref:Tetraspanin n=1 Tax=Helobdella robusta TaxID=6412 RepID=T1FGX2_HELRO|nr:hypothetical protein HELRODRAFT_181356 [Helobdella robusta]ESN92484.1 hypothetical protein HELRODRAFT_181356 [Helobdella robusta]
MENYVPTTCCEKMGYNIIDQTDYVGLSMCQRKENPSFIYHKPCFEAVVEEVAKIKNVLIIIIGSLAILKFILIVLSVNHMKTIKHESQGFLSRHGLNPIKRLKNLF